MPFEIAPKTEQQQRQILGRIALNAIADHILTLPPDRIDMGKWCGTACCAIGHGVSLPEVQATGLYLALNPKPASSTGTMAPAFNGKVGFHESIAAAFAITVDQSTRFFSYADHTALQVATDIRNYLARTA